MRRVVNHFCFVCFFVFLVSIHSPNTKNHIRKRHTVSLVCSYRFHDGFGKLSGRTMAMAVHRHTVHQCGWCVVCCGTDCNETNEDTNDRKMHIAPCDRAYRLRNFCFFSLVVSFSILNLHKWGVCIHNVYAVYGHCVRTTGITLIPTCYFNRSKGLVVIFFFSFSWSLSMFLLRVVSLFSICNSYFSSSSAMRLWFAASAFLLCVEWVDSEAAVIVI